MINLLPLGEKQKLFLEKQRKLAMIFGIVVVVFLVCLILVLLSIKFYILADTDYQKNILYHAQRENQTPDFTNTNITIKKYNEILSQLDSFYAKEMYFNQSLKIISGIPTPAGLYLTDFSMSRDGNGNVQVGLSGFSDTRDNLLVFQKNIESEQEIKNPLFSSESWINSENANFSLTFEIDQNEKQQ